MRFETKLAWRHLVSGGGQTVLTVFAVAIAVTVIIFIQTLITGVQQRFVNDLVGPLPHITVKPRDPSPTSLDQAGGDSGVFYATAREKQVQQRTDLEDWPRLEKMLATYPGIKTVASGVGGSGFLSRGEKRLAVSVSGGEPAKLEKISPIQKDIIAGRWLDITPSEIVIGQRLATEAGVKLGDRVLIRSSLGIGFTYTVAGLFDTGNANTDLRNVFMTLRAAQSLFGTGQNVTSIQLKVEDPFEATKIADQIAASLPYKVDAWTKDSAFILNAIQSQNASRIMICSFVLLASAFGIASVLIVSVVQKSKQIGILKSMGARDRQILTVFTLEGLGVALAGSLVGCALGFLLLNALSQIPQAARAGKVDKLFNIIYDPLIFGGAVAATVIATLIAAILPARRASKLNPVEVIRG
jgi:lipoprotein-releasing system permease protein